MRNDNVLGFLVSAVVILGLAIGLIAGVMWGLPKYNVYRATMRGTAELRQAESNRQILVYEAQAKLDSASLNAQAEIERAKGVAESNKIIGSSLKDNEGYLRWLWINNLQETQNSIIYIPTETGLPILEAGKR